MAFVAPIVGPIVNLLNCLWDCSGKHMSYLCNLQKNLDSLEDAMRELKDVRDPVNQRVELAEAEGKRRIPEVGRWLKRVEDIDSKVKQMLPQGSPRSPRRQEMEPPLQQGSPRSPRRQEMEPPLQQGSPRSPRSPRRQEMEPLLQQGSPRNPRRQEVEQGCINLKCWSNYKLGEKVVRMLETVRELKREGSDFGEVADRTNQRQVQRMPDSPTVGTEILLKKALKLLADDEVSILGIHGMGGVGKTTLLKKINNAFDDKGSSRGHDVMVIWVTVSKELNVERIQKVIGKRLGFKWAEEKDQSLDEEARTHAIFNILSDKKFVLLLDDCWAGVDLKSIGVPLPNRLHHEASSSGGSSSNKYSKVVFTTRSEIVCGQMEAKKKIRVECLDLKKAWQLFEEKVGEDALNSVNSDPHVRELAQDVAKECGGLPLALITVGRSMASKKRPEEWRHAITMLRKSASEFSGMGDEVFPVLKFSYDYLQNDVLRSCFLYCSLYPEDYNIEKEELIRHWIGEGFLDGFDSMDEAYDKGHDIIGSLKAVCLLESGDYGEDHFVKMHDVIRDLAIWIGCECGRERNKFLVQAGIGLSVAPPAEKWTEAKRISLMQNTINVLKLDQPTCTNLLTLLLLGNMQLRDINDNFFQFMPTLKVLNLSRCRISHLPKSISKLAQLQFLNLSNCFRLNELPSELKNLVKLRILNLAYTNCLSTIPRGVISALSNLQTLEVLESKIYANWEIDDFVHEAGNIGGLSLVEVESLEYLSYFSLNVKSVEVLQKFLISNKLQMCTRGLKIEECEGLISVDILPSSTAALSASTSLSSLNLGVMKNLQSLDILDCALEILTINCEGEDKELSLFPRLESLYLWKLPKLTIVWEGGLNRLSFQKLKTITIYSCHTLKEVTWLLYVPNLQRLRASDCNELESILDGDAETNEKMKPFSRLQEFSLQRLPKLKSICRHALPFPFLKNIEVPSCPLLAKLPFDCNTNAQNTLKKIRGDVEWWNMLQWEDEAVKSSFLPFFVG